MKTLYVLAVALAVMACQKAQPDPAVGSWFDIEFRPMVGNQPLQLNGPSYTNALGESFRVTKLAYYVSNIRLKQANGPDYVVPQDSSYFLVQADRPETQTVVLTNVPPGRYTGLSFVLGVDSLRSTMGVDRRTGALDPGRSGQEPMYWEWNSGYIFMKLEGTSPVAPAAQNGQFVYHIGGFGGGFNGKKTINNLRTINVQFGNDVAEVTRSLVPKVTITADVLGLLNGPTNVSVARNSAVMFEPFSSVVANNYAAGMFRYAGMTAVIVN